MHTSDTKCDITSNHICNNTCAGNMCSPSTRHSELFQLNILDIQQAIILSLTLLPISTIIQVEHSTLHCGSKSRRHQAYETRLRFLSHPGSSLYNKCNFVKYQRQCYPCLRRHWEYISLQPIISIITRSSNITSHYNFHFHYRVHSRYILNSIVQNAFKCLGFRKSRTQSDEKVVLCPVFILSSMQKRFSEMLFSGGGEGAADASTDAA